MLLYYEPHKFSSVLLISVYMPPAADTINACVARIQAQHPETFVAVSGDFNHCSLDYVLPTFHQFVDCSTRKNRTLALFVCKCIWSHCPAPTRTINSQPGGVVASVCSCSSKAFMSLYTRTVMAYLFSTLNLQTPMTEPSVCSTAFILCWFWYIFRDLADAYLNAVNRAVPTEIVGAVLRSLAHVWPVKGPNKKKTKTETSELGPHAAMYVMATQTPAVYWAASFYVSFQEGALSWSPPPSPCLLWSETDYRTWKWIWCLPSGEYIA